MRKAAVVLALLMLGGCVSDQGGAGNATVGSAAPAGSFADQARESNSDDAWKSRSMCQDTSIGNEAKTVCY